MNALEVLNQTRDAMTARRVYGEPYQQDGVTVIPAANVWRGEGRAPRTAPAIGRLEMTACAVRRVVERADFPVEVVDRVACDGFRSLGRGQEHEVVAAHVTEEGVSLVAGDRREDGGEPLDEHVSAREAVVIVERLEGVDVHPEARERVAPVETRLDLVRDRAVARQARERVEGAQLRGARERARDAGPEPVDVEGLRAVIVGPRGGRNA